MQKVVHSQKILFERIKKIYNDNFHNKSNDNFYFCSYNFSVGYSLLKFYQNKLQFYLIFKFFIKEIVSLFKINNYKILGKLDNENFKKAVVTWGNNSNISKDFFYDKYFNQKTNEHDDILWLVIFNGDENILKGKQIQNVIFIIEEKTNFFEKVKFLFRLFINFFCKETKNMENFLFYFSWHNAFKIKLENIFNKYLNINLQLLLLPFEGQPFQFRAIQIAKKATNNRVMVKGYIHSVPSYPSHLLYKKFYPDHLIVSSNDQFNFFKAYILPQSHKIELLPSARFYYQEEKDMYNKIFLPIEFYSESLILKKITYLLKNFLANNDFSKYEVKNHPACYNSVKHIKLSNKINEIIKNNKNKVKTNLNKNSIFIGSTGSIVEALEVGVEVFHITEDSTLEVYSDFIWDNVKVSEIEENLYKYSLTNKNKTLIFQKNKEILNEYKKS